MNRSGTLTSAQGYLTLDATPNDTLTVTVNSGTYSVENPPGTVIASGTGASATYSLTTSQAKIVCRSGSLSYTLTDVTDNYALTQGQTEVVQSIADPSVVRIGYSSAYACDRTGTTDCSAAFTAAVQAVANTSAFGASGLSDARSRAVIEIPPGQYLITQLSGMLGLETHASKTFGLTFKGAGRGAVQIIFQPASAGALCTNNKWIDVRFEGIEFIAKTAGCTLFTGPGTSNEQEFTWERCSFYSWKYVLSLLGTNNNSEAYFHRCGNYSMEAAGAWVFSPSSGGVDQFLNYWFKSCKHWSTSAPIIDMSVGGHIDIDTMDVSAWGASAVASPATPQLATYLFKLKGSNHNLGVTRFSCRELRGEFQHAEARLLYSEWGGYGGVSFKGVDLSSQTGSFTYGTAMVYLSLPNASGSAYLFEDCPGLAGGVSIEYGINAWQMDHRVKFADCSWFQKTNPSDVLTFIPSGAHGNLNLPIVEFEGCRSSSSSAYNFSSATAFPAWDASIGSMSIPSVCTGATRIQPKKRWIVLNSVYSGLQGTDVGFVRLPLGALITDCTATAYVGASSQGTAGTWTIQSDKGGSPTTIATLTTPGALSAGFTVGGALATPYKCSTAAKSVLAITPSSVTAAGDTTLLIGGYW